MPPNIAARIERHDEHTYGIRIAPAENRVLPDRHVAAIGCLLHRVEVCNSRSSRSEFPLPLHGTCAVELENQGAGELAGAGRAPNGNVAAISRLSDLPDYAVSGPSGISEGPDNSALRVKFLYQGALGVRSATDDATAQDIASVRCLLGGDAEGVIPGRTARAPDFSLPLRTSRCGAFDDPIDAVATRGVSQGQREVASVRGGCHTFGSEPVFDLLDDVPVRFDEQARACVSAGDGNAAARPHYARGKHQKEQTRARQHDCDGGFNHARSHNLEIRSAQIFPGRHKLSSRLARLISG